MGKRGGAKHLKRIAAPTAVPIHNKKAHVWLKKPSPGPHGKYASVSLLVLIRDVLQLALNSSEAKKIISTRSVEVDGKVRTDTGYPVGLMDVVSLPKADLYYRIVVDRKGRLVPLKISKEEAKKKIAKVLGKYTSKGRLFLRFHDGHTVCDGKGISVGDSAVLTLPEKKIESILKCEKGARCIIREGRHAGTIATLEEILKRKEGRVAEARLKGSTGEFITVASYLFVVDEEFRGSE